MISQTTILRQFAVTNGIEIGSRGNIAKNHPVHAAYAASLVPAEPAVPVKKARKSKSTAALSLVA